MKKSIFLFIAFSISIFSCKHKKETVIGPSDHIMIARAWMLESYTVDGIDSTQTKMDFGFDSTYIGLIPESDYICSNPVTIGKIGMAQPERFCGNHYKTWDIGDNRELLLEYNVFFSWDGYRSFSSLPIYLLGPSQMTKIKISKLTNDELWLDDSFNGTHYEIHLKPYIN